MYPMQRNPFPPRTMTLTPKAPFFVSNYADEHGGVDFLGIRTVNFALMDEFMPGINNVTTSIRPYSVMTWIAWTFKEEKKRKSEQEAKLSEFVGFREKIEILFGWSHQIRCAGGGLVGNAQRLPEGIDEVPLNFPAWKRRVSWLDAGNYGPSLKTQNGLGFIAQVRPGIFKVTNSGERLAKALDGSLRNCDHYNELRSLDIDVGSAELADSLYPHWMTTSPTNNEAKAFGRVFYVPEKSGENSRVGRRSAAISLILWALNNQEAPVSVAELRRYMTYCDVGCTSESMSRVQGLWRVLQLRQAQRLAAETLFGWIEIEILGRSRNLSTQIVDDLIALVKKHGNTEDISNHWVSIEIKLLAEKKGVESYLDAAKSRKALDIFAHMNLINRALEEDRDVAAVRALQLLIYCAELTLELEQNKHCSRYLGVGGGSRISLLTWKKFVVGGRDLSAKTFLLDMIENYFLSQHFGVAAARYTEGTQRLRVTIEEGGLVSMLRSTNKALYPTVTPDRLRSALSLMTDCGLISRIHDGDRECYKS